MALTNSPAYTEAASVFNPQQTQADIQSNPLISELKRMQDVARRKAMSSVNRGFQTSGFGNSTFVAPAVAQAGTQAGSSYAGQIAQTGQQQGQQNIQNFMNLLGIGQQGEQFNKSFGLQQQQMQEAIRQFEEAQRLKRSQSQMGFNLGALQALGKQTSEGSNPLYQAGGVALGNAILPGIGGAVGGWLGGLFK